MGDAEYALNSVSFSPFVIWVNKKVWCPTNIFYTELKS